jgi:hypothetical protein
MGYEGKWICPQLMVSLDRHAGETEQRQNKLFGELQAEIEDAVLAIVQKEKYAELNIFVNSSS